MTDPRYMSLSTLESYVDACETTIENWMTLEGFPAPKRIGKGRTRRWDRVKVDAWMNGTQDNTAIDLIGRITNATRREALRKDHERGVRKRDQGVHGIGQVSDETVIRHTEDV